MVNRMKGKRLKLVRIPVLSEYGDQENFDADAHIFSNLLDTAEQPLDVKTNAVTQNGNIVNCRGGVHFINSGLSEGNITYSKTSHNESNGSKGRIATSHMMEKNAQNRNAVTMVDYIDKFYEETIPLLQNPSALPEAIKNLRLILKVEPNYPPARNSLRYAYKKI